MIKKKTKGKVKKLELALKTILSSCFAMKTSVATECCSKALFVGFMPSVFLSSVTRQTNVHRFTEQ